VNRVISDDGTSIAFERFGEGRPVNLVGDLRPGGDPPEILAPVLAEFFDGREPERSL
jgi:hypothetical protein